MNSYTISTQYNTEYVGNKKPRREQIEEDGSTSLQQHQVGAVEVHPRNLWIMMASVPKSFRWPGRDAHLKRKQKITYCLQIIDQMHLNFIYPFNFEQEMAYFSKLSQDSTRKTYTPKAKFYFIY